VTVYLWVRAIVQKSSNKTKKIEREKKKKIKLLEQKRKQALVFFDKGWITERICKKLHVGNRCLNDWISEEHGSKTGAKRRPCYEILNKAIRDRFEPGSTLTYLQICQLAQSASQNKSLRASRDWVEGFVKRKKLEEDYNIEALNGYPLENDHTLRRIKF